MLNRLKFTMQAEEDEDDLEHLKCGICLGLCDRPVTAPCQHNFCLKCFRKWVNQDKKQCPSCRAELTRALITNPRINTMLTGRIRQAQKVRVSPPRMWRSRRRPEMSHSFGAKFLHYDEGSERQSQISQGHADCWHACFLRPFTWHWHLPVSDQCVLCLQPKSQRAAVSAIRHVPQDDRPDEAYMTAKAKRKGLSNAASGRMRVTCPPHHFGPIGAAPAHVPYFYLKTC